MNAEIVSVGTELLLGQIVDTHAPRMANLLAECGIGCLRRVTVGDNLERIVAALKEALARADLVITIGGLGPTQDDLTRDAIALALGDRLETVPEMADQLRLFFESRKIPWAESNLRQAEKPTSGRFIDNPNGTAPGLICERDGKRVVALPGPKGEFNPMADGPVRAYLEGVSPGRVIHSRVVRICGIGESYVESLVRDLLDSKNPTVAPYAHPGEVHLRVTASAKDRVEANAMIDPVVAAIQAKLGRAVFGFDETSLEEAVLADLRGRRQTLAVAESMTGGWLGERLTSVAGSSEVFLGGVIAYTAGVKRELLGVSSATLEAFGPVSAECAQEMAVGVRDRFRASFGIAITGNAGPSADAGGAPVGQVYLALAGPAGVRVEAGTYRGIREDVRRRATQAALVMLREAPG